MIVLIVDDEDTARYGMRKALASSGQIREAAGLKSASRLLREERPDLVLLDLNLGGEDGFELLRESQQLDPPPAVIVITAHGNEKVAVDAMKQGAYHYLAKPFDLEELRLTCRNVARQVELRQENRSLRAELERSTGYGEMIGDSEPMRRVFSLVERVAGTDVTVLLTGESGSGKELVAREIHRRSGRTGPLVCVNCAAIPENLIESELFGHEKGAFTGAESRRIGKFEQARGGTLFLDEIGDMPRDTQAKILRALEERQIERLGGQEPLEVDVRIVSATHQDLPQMVRGGKFREDLYYRLEVVTLDVPPLRERQGDVLALIRHFLRHFAEKHGRPAPELEEGALRRLLDYPYPGNVRQLRNLMERLVVLSAEGRIGEGDLPAEVRFFVDTPDGPVAGDRLEGLLQMDFRGARESFEIQYLLWQLRRHDNNITHTAEAIGIHRQSLQQKIKDLNLRPLLE